MGYGNRGKSATFSDLPVVISFVQKWTKLKTYTKVGIFTDNKYRLHSDLHRLYTCYYRVYRFYGLLREGNAKQGLAAIPKTLLKGSLNDISEPEANWRDTL